MKENRPVENLADYLEKYKAAKELTVVGPLFEGEAKFSEPVVFVDGGSRYRTRDIGFRVGDGDSSCGELDMKLNAEKDFSDLAFVFTRVGGFFGRIRLLGFLGGRRDHELINLAEAHSFLQARKSTQLSFDERVRGYSAGEWTLQVEGLFSLFAFAEAHVKLSGACRYPIADGTLKPLSSHGLSNVGHGEVHLACRGPVFLFFPI